MPRDLVLRIITIVVVPKDKTHRMPEAHAATHAYKTPPEMKRCAQLFAVLRPAVGVMGRPPAVLVDSDGGKHTHTHTDTPGEKNRNHPPFSKTKPFL